MTDTQLASSVTTHQRGTRAAVGGAERGHGRKAAASRAGRETYHRGRDEWLTVDEVCAELNIGRRTFERWRTLGIAPRATRPTRNGPLRIKRSWLDEWAEDGAS